MTLMGSAGVQAREIAFAHGRKRTLPPHTSVFVAGEAAESVYYVESGFVKIVSPTADGKELILTFVGRGAVFGEEALFGVRKREEFASIVEPAELWVLPSERFRQYLENDAQFATQWCGWVAERWRRMERRLKHLMFLSHRDRVIHALLDLAEEFGEYRGATVLLHPRLSHQELAAYVGATRETVTSVLLELRAAGLVVAARRRLTLVAVDRLAALVGRAPPHIPQPSRAPFPGLRELAPSLPPH
ncbi:MAG: hypothetical protein KatS3mg110_0143 [Pirellulaceae bacterium]|nr:MAG: hypothetical protein KatS3mg110_0143 [Pirellulaceae bacterium]